MDLPSDVCHPIYVLSTSLHPCSRRPKKLPDLHPTSSRDSSVHADQARFGGTTRWVARFSLADLVVIFTSDVSVAVPVPITLASQPSVTCQTRRDDFHKGAVTRFSFRSPETSSTGVDSSA